MRYVMHRTDRALPRRSRSRASLWWLALVRRSPRCSLLARRRPRRARVAGALVALLVALDLLHFADGYNPMRPAAVAMPPRTAAIAYLQRHAGEGRIAGIGFAARGVVHRLRAARRARL